MDKSIAFKMIKNFKNFVLDQNNFFFEIRDLILKIFVGMSKSEFGTDHL